MPHIDALTLMMYVDGELSDMEAAAVRDHVNACAGCRRALEMQQAEEKWVAERFFAADLPPLPMELDPLTIAQVEGIALLHKRNRRRFWWRILLVAGSMLISLACYLLFWQKIWAEWALPIWTAWRSQLFWSSAFWLNDSARDLFHAPAAYLIALPLPFLLLAGLLLVLNLRFSPLSTSRFDKQEVK
ncbi:zf-HC2 domain-containing protein [Brevibacillus composti]|uniref:Anti-sigma-W factor RsiW n=1 Tax=Brevibacillus composti TaxID=2796470 RepID=A0A7T5EJZ0_9BACL|nr:zf-HC2 domain-containing protein [Brevibacillus composti]QQE74035.1 zf-HC2 domain-containing protein [Brevibacillus composti]QUO41119.1 zf-HC2 domain-containing protein [Brevibacillus composti]